MKNNIACLALICAGFMLASCGGGGSGGGGGGGGGGGLAPTPSYTVGGTVSGLDSSGLVLQNNGADDLTVAANGTFSFASLASSGAAYAVTVKSQPNLPLQICTVTAGSGTVGSGAVTSVAVSCATRTAKFLYVTNPGSQNVSAFSINASTGMLTEAAGSPFATQPTPRYVTSEPTGKFLYVTSIGSSTVPPRVSGYSMNATTGALTEVPTSPYDLSVPPPPAGATNILPPLLHPSGAFGYLGVPGSNGQLYGATLNSSTGELTQIPGMPTTAGANPGLGTFDSAGRFYLVPSSVSLAGPGEVLTYQVSSPSGVPTLLGSTPTGGNNPISLLIPGDKFLLVTNFTSGNLAEFSVSAAGTLTPVGSPLSIGPAGSWLTPPAYHRRLNTLYMASISSASVSVTPSLSAFRLDTVTGALTPLAGSPYSTNGETGSLFVNATGKYLLQSTGSGLQRYSIDQTTGVPTLLGSVMTLHEAGSHVYVPELSGRFLFVANYPAAGGQITVSVYAVDAASGTATWLTTQPAGTVLSGQLPIPQGVGLQ